MFLEFILALLVYLFSKDAKFEAVICIYSFRYHSVERMPSFLYVIVFVVISIGLLCLSYCQVCFRYLLLCYQSGIPIHKFLESQSTEQCVMLPGYNRSLFGYHLTLTCTDDDTDTS